MIYVYVLKIFQNVSKHNLHTCGPYTFYVYVDKIYIQKMKPERTKMIRIFPKI